MGALGRQFPDFVISPTGANRADVEQTSSSNGMRSASVAEKAVYSVVTRQADGSLDEACVTGEDAANALVNHAHTAQAKEHRHEAQ